jgi:hypothetical protein
VRVLLLACFPPKDWKRIEHEVPLLDTDALHDTHAAWLASNEPMHQRKEE